MQILMIVFHGQKNFLDWTIVNLIEGIVVLEVQNRLRRVHYQSSDNNITYFFPTILKNREKRNEQTVTVPCAQGDHSKYQPFYGTGFKTLSSYVSYQMIIYYTRRKKIATFFEKKKFNTQQYVVVVTQKRDLDETAYTGTIFQDLNLRSLKSSSRRR